MRTLLLILVSLAACSPTAPPTLFVDASVETTLSEEGDGWRCRSDVTVQARGEGSLVWRGWEATFDEGRIIYDAGAARAWLGDGMEAGETVTTWTERSLDELPEHYTITLRWQDDEGHLGDETLDVACGE